MQSDRPSNSLDRPHLILCIGVVAAVMGGIVLSCWNWYQRGVTFTPGMWSFLYLLYLAGVVVGAGVLLVVVWCVALLRRRKLGEARYTASALATLVIMVVCMAGVTAWEPLFYWGRERAYRQIDAVEVAIACRELAGAVDDGTIDDWTDGMRYAREGYEGLPRAIQDLQPCLIYVARNGVVLQMDGGGAIMYDEGIWVPLENDAVDANRYTSTALYVLSIDPPVFVYRLDDFRELPLLEQSGAQ